MISGNLTQVSKIIILDKTIFNKINPDNQSPNPRFGHTSTLFNKKIYLIGGKIKLNNDLSLMAEIDIFNLGKIKLNIEDKHWTSPLLISKNYLKLRRNHIAELVNNQVFVHGGFDEDDNIISDSHLLTLMPNIKWSKVSLLSKTITPALAGHTSCLVIPSDLKSNPKFSVYSTPNEHRGFKKIKKVLTICLK